MPKRSRSCSPARRATLRRAGGAARALEVEVGRRRVKKKGEVVGRNGGDEPEALGILEAPGERLRLLQVLERPPEVAQRRQRRAQLEPDVHPHLRLDPAR